MSARELCWDLVERYNADGLDTGELVTALTTIVAQAESDVYVASAEVERNLSAQIVILKAQVAALKDSCAKSVSVDTPKLFSQAHEMKSRLIEYIKWIRSSGVVTVVDKDGNVPLYVARYIAVFVFAYYGWDEYHAPVRGEAIAPLDINSSRGEVADAIKELLAVNFKGYVVAVSDPYEC